MWIVLCALAGWTLLSVAIDMGYRLGDYYNRHRRSEGWKNLNDYARAVSIAGRSMMLARFPRVRVSDQRRLVLIDLLMGRYYSADVKGWQYAMLTYGLEGTIIEKSPVVRRFLRNPLRNIDDGFMLYALNKKLVDGSNEVLQKKWAEFYHKIEYFIKEKRVLPYRMGGRMALVDTLPFVCPLLFMMAKRSGESILRDYALYLLRDFRNKGFSREWKVYAHAYDIEKGFVCESIGWGRGTGWYMLANAFCLQEAESQADKKELIDNLKEASDVVLRYQRADGGWGTKLSRGLLLDLSATSLIALSLCVLYRASVDENLWTSISNAIRCIIQSTNDCGVVMSSEGTCHDVGNYAHHYGSSALTQGTVVVLFEYLKKEGLLDKLK